MTRAWKEAERPTGTKGKFENTKKINKRANVRNERVMIITKERSNPNFKLQICHTHRFINIIINCNNVLHQLLCLTPFGVLLFEKVSFMLECEAGETCNHSFEDHLIPAFLRAFKESSRERLL